ncbi:MAG: fatty acid desaturase [bacterium]|mmetsp:Transcript_14494/g.41326  ORF Transcript_14494/g.41326 Transcript_14494/m.41326 type:complete len:388 (+) Transcript_14494:220-1383(+)|eukprot:CAMPEP_0182607378 /NCGR_PEP_ID=MMETSP1330-20130603/2073_1 /TAXON_ID=464278 /ORGANISM="Picochlorum sp., Strain RCC944" /LENGTH=387 /DNA_ID=CAMNT_0024825967 /DNA_START=184 /DNA_END=1350 /DNA_ORIENTATION=-
MLGQARAVSGGRRMSLVVKRPALLSRRAVQAPLVARVASSDVRVSDEVAPPAMGELSYNDQYAHLYAEGADKLNVRRPIPRPVRDLQEKAPGAKKVPFSDVYGLPKKNLFFNREYNTNDKIYLGFMLAMHGLCLLAPATFSWPMVGLFFVTYFVSGCLGITLSYHRQLSHKSFSTPKWLEYVLAYCGVLAVQGPPMEWASAHRYHHLHCDSPLDPHSPYEGFWWSHMGWLLDNEATMERVHDRSNVAEMVGDPFYEHLEKWFPLHAAAQFAALFAFGGLPAVVWGGALRLVWVYHVTWAINSVCHVWGDQPYDASDLSRNNWWMGILAWGEGWHNNHHAFEWSARHGLEPNQIDVTYAVIRLLEVTGLASNVKIPTDKQKARLAVSN